MLALKRQDAPAATRAEAKTADKDRPGKASNRDWASPTDPDARVLQHPDKHTHLSYHLDATVDLESGVIVAAGADYADHSDCANLPGSGRRGGGERGGGRRDAADDRGRQRASQRGEPARD